MEGYKKTDEHEDAKWEKSLNWQLDKLSTLLTKAKTKEEKMEILEKMKEIYETLKIEDAPTYSEKEHKKVNKKLEKIHMKEKENIATQKLEEIRKEEKRKFYERLRNNFESSPENRDWQMTAEEEKRRETKNTENEISKTIEL